jgi:hypothetical protein
MGLFMGDFRRKCGAPGRVQTNGPRAVTSGRGVPTALRQVEVDRGEPLRRHPHLPTGLAAIGVAMIVTTLVAAGWFFPTATPSAQGAADRAAHGRSAAVAQGADHRAAHGRSAAVTQGSATNQGSVTNGAQAPIGTFPSQPPPTTLPTSGSFTVSGNSILQPNGQRYVPYGFVLEWCAPMPALPCNAASPTLYQKISEAATYWHANTVRLQVSWEQLYSGPNGTVNTLYLSQLDREIQQANSLNMVAILTQQTEHLGGSIMPDSHSLTFWTFIANRYKSDPLVMFDLFNEPRLSALDVGGKDQLWSIWQNGGTVTGTTDGSNGTYVGMQTVVNTVRATGATNIVIAEGTGGDHDLSGLATHALTGPNIAYGTENSLRLLGNVPNYTQAQWAANFGIPSQTYPIMMEAFLGTPGTVDCDPNSPTVFPQLLNYLQANGLGMIYFTLDAGEGIVGTNLEQPTTFQGSQTLNCAAPQAPNTVGPGQAIHDWFAANSTPIG